MNWRDLAALCAVIDHMEAHGLTTSPAYAQAVAERDAMLSPPKPQTTSKGRK